MEYKPDVNIEKNSCEAGSESMDRSQGNELSCVSCGNEDKLSSKTNCLTRPTNKDKVELDESREELGGSNKVVRKVNKDITKTRVKPWWAKAISLLADLDQEKTQREIAHVCGVTEKTLSHTLNHNKEFKRMYAEAVSVMLAESKPKIDKALVKKANSGDTSAIRLYYERAENMQNRLRTDLAIEVDVL